MPGGLDRSRRGSPVLVIEPCAREPPEEYSLGTRPTKGLMVLPVNRCQSPISAASANPVRVLTLRRHPSRRTSGVNSELAATSPIAARFGHQHRVVVESNASRVGRSLTWGSASRRSHASCFPAHHVLQRFARETYGVTLDIFCGSAVLAHGAPLWGCAGLVVEFRVCSRPLCGQVSARRTSTIRVAKVGVA